MPIPIRHVILDRDGVLNVERGDGGYIETAVQWNWLPRALDALHDLGAANIKVSIATNQAGVGRGRIARADLDALHARMVREADHAGGCIDHVFVCPHAPEDGCDCRKPAPGLIIRAMARSGIPASATVLVGDDTRDLEAARAAGVRAVLVRTGKGVRSETVAVRAGIPVFDDLAAFVSALLVNPIQRTLNEAT
ncbi:MAG TPA: HAD-IIIA family hydrolase [Rhodanobacteraceae bacterium]|nr:HAD-IIIA family hydrolase [Rhodanobacteraceae bacterium]